MKSPTVVAMLMFCVMGAAIADTPPPPPAATITYGGGDGSSAEKAILIIGAKGEADGVDSEYRWIDVHFPGWKHDVSQGTLNPNHRVYDRLEFTDASGNRHTIYFDITDYFGKY